MRTSCSTRKADQLNRPPQKTSSAADGERDAEASDRRRPRRAFPGQRDAIAADTRAFLAAAWSKGWLR
jgi:hypothetical protein